MLGFATFPPTLGSFDYVAMRFGHDHFVQDDSAQERQGKAGEITGD